MEFSKKKSLTISNLNFKIFQRSFVRTIGKKIQEKFESPGIWPRGSND